MLYLVGYEGTVQFTNITFRNLVGTGYQQVINSARSNVIFEDCNFIGQGAGGDSLGCVSLAFDAIGTFRDCGFGGRLTEIVKTEQRGSIRVRNTTMNLVSNITQIGGVGTLFRIEDFSTVNSRNATWNLNGFTVTAGSDARFFFNSQLICEGTAFWRPSSIALDQGSSICDTVTSFTIPGNEGEYIQKGASITSNFDLSSIAQNGTHRRFQINTANTYTINLTGTDAGRYFYIQLTAASNAGARLNVLGHLLEPDQYVMVMYNAASGWQIISSAENTAFDDSALSITAENTQEAIRQTLIKAQDKNFGVAGEGSGAINAFFFVVTPVNTTAVPATVTPQAFPSSGSWFLVSDSRGNAATNNITVDFTGTALNGVPNDMYVINTDRGCAQFIYINATIGYILKA